MSVRSTGDARVAWNQNRAAPVMAGATGGGEARGKEKRQCTRSAVLCMARNGEDNERAASAGRVIFFKRDGCVNTAGIYTKYDTQCIK